MTATDWSTDRAALWQKAWSLLAAGGSHRFVTLATLAPHGPTARLVVLRDADAGACTLTMFTDSASHKIAELRADPRAALHHWTPEEDVQIRLDGKIEITTGPALEEAWTALSPAQRTSYGVKPTPGRQIETSDGYTRVPDFAQFASLTFRADSIDIVHLGRDLHRRALYRRADNWIGTWRAP